MRNVRVKRSAAEMSSLILVAFLEIKGPTRVNKCSNLSGLMRKYLKFEVIKAKTIWTISFNQQRETESSPYLSEANTEQSKQSLPVYIEYFQTFQLCSPCIS